MESRNNIVELQYAERASVMEERTELGPVDDIHQESGDMGLESGRVDSPTERSESPDPSVVRENNSATDADDDSKHVSSEDDMQGMGTTAAETARSRRGPSNTNVVVANASSRPGSMYRRPGAADINRESKALLQIIPYRPQPTTPGLSNRLLTNGQPSSNVRPSDTLEATYSVRLLLDKWTTSGSAPIEDVLEEEIKVES